MTYEEFLNQVIEQGMQAARRDYTRPQDEPRLQGSLKGFQACQGLAPFQLRQLLQTTAERSTGTLEQDPENVLFAQCYAAEVEWVCNVVSAALVNTGQRPIIEPTARGMLMAAEILGVADV